MFRSVIQRQTRVVAQLRGSSLGHHRRFYSTDGFTKREEAAESMFIREQEKKKLEALKEQLDKAKKQVDDLEAKIDQRHRDADAKTKK